MISSVSRSSDIVRAWRLLLAEADVSGRWATVNIPWSDVQATQRPVIGVIRIDGRLDEARIPALLDQVMARIEPVSARLPASRSTMTARPPSLRPTRVSSPRCDRGWRRPQALDHRPADLDDSGELERLTRDLDEIVLQVHAVDDPRRGLFDPDQAERWVREFGQRIRRPFRVALPAYDVRVTWRPDGRLASVEGEMPLRAGATNGELLPPRPRRS